MTKQERRHGRSVDVRINWLQPHVGGFKDWLDERNYSPATIIEVVRLLATWADWVRAKGFELETLAAGLTASASVFRGSKKERAPQSAAKLFMTYLREENVLPPVHVPSLEETWPQLAAFRHWMRDQRGIKDSTLDTYQGTLIDLLAVLGTDPAAYTATAIRDFVLARAKPHGRGRARGITVATRAYLKYLVAIGHCPIGREHAVPTFACWQLATVPRFLGQTDIDRLLASCKNGRLRDCAIIFLLARLGLRASEIANLTFGDIDWRKGLLTLSGKSRREEHLPLTQEVGDAILAYIEMERPRIPTTRVFLTETAPIRPIRRIAVKCLVRRALDRAGIASVHRGAHVLRHSAATAMLRSGASLAGVGTVLRHRSPSATALYAKFARFLCAEDPRHEIPRAELTRNQKARPVPYIYTPDEIARILDAAGSLRYQKPNPLRRQLYVMLFGLIAATGLRVSEALALRLDDIEPGGVLHIRETKFRKSRLVPLHGTVVEALDLYLALRRQYACESDWLFTSVQHREICPSTVNNTFRCILRRAGIAPERRRKPRIHDLRHTFATRVLEQCGAERRAVARHFVALSTYLGHVDVRNTYWYLEATPGMMADIALAAEMLVGESAA